MGRKPLAQSERRVKLHVGNVMVPTWAEEAIRQHAVATGQYIKTVLEEVITRAAKRLTKPGRQRRRPVG